MRFERYPKYKDSGIEWIGEIPEHWEIRKLGHIGIFSASGIDKKIVPSQPLVKIINFVDIVNNEKRILNSQKKYMIVSAPKDAIKKHLVIKGDLIFMPSSEVVDEIGLSALVDEDLVNTSYSYHVLRFRFTKDIYHSFRKYLTNNKFVLNQFSRRAKGTIRQTLSRNDFKSIFVIIPSQQEQIQIAKYLDKKTDSIDKAIKTKEKLIEKLKELKQSIINEAVTKGLRKDVKYKDSGIEWIGKIPEHWEVRKLKFIIKSKLKYGANESGVEYNKNLPRYIRITDFSKSGKLSEKNKLSLPWEKAKNFLLNDGDILFARSGATVGKTYQFKKSMSNEKFYAFAGYLIKVEANKEIILPDYLYIYTKSEVFQKWKELIFNRATIENIGADKYAELFVTLPPLEEQEVVLKKYNLHKMKIDKAIELQQKEIEKLKEYKASLIDSVVTGKIKVA